ncbi:MAG: tetratricopeptide repeat protein [Tepidiformaceae bacterium]
MKKLKRILAVMLLVVVAAAAIAAVVEVIRRLPVRSPLILTDEPRPWSPPGEGPAAASPVAPAEAVPVADGVSAGSEARSAPPTDPKAPTAEPEPAAIADWPMAPAPVAPAPVAPAPEVEPGGERAEAVDAGPAPTAAETHDGSAERPSPYDVADVDGDEEEEMESAATEYAPTAAAETHAQSAEPPSRWAAADVDAEEEMESRAGEYAPATGLDEGLEPPFPPLEAPGGPAESAPSPELVAEFVPALAPQPEAAADAPPSLPSTLEEALSEVPESPIPTFAGRNAEAFLDEGNVYFNVGQYGLAIERYTRAIELSADLVAAYYNRANARTRSLEYDLALEDYDAALRLQPDDADALNNRGMLHLYRASYREALSDFNEALRADPGDTTVMVNRGLAYVHSGDPASALIDFQDAVAADPQDAAANYGAAQAAAMLGNRDRALRSLSRAFELDAGYAREAAADPRLTTLQGDKAFMRLLRDAGARA